MQAPPLQLPVLRWHWLGGLSQTTFAHGSFLQSPVAASQPEAQGESDWEKEQEPLPLSHDPPENERELLPTHVGPGGVQTVGVPVQRPAASHLSAVVQAAPSLQAVPVAFLL